MKIGWMVLDVLEHPCTPVALDPYRSLSWNITTSNHELPTVIVLLGRMSITDGVEVEAWVPKSAAVWLGKKNTHMSHVDSSGGSGHVVIQVHNK